MDFSNVTSNLTVTAKYTINTYSVTFKAIDNGTILGDTKQTVKYYSSATSVEAVPSTGYQFVKWQDGNGNTLSTDNPLTVINVISDSNLYAVFEKESSVTGSHASRELTISPNPTIGLINILLEEGAVNTELTVYSLTGNLVYSNPSFNGGVVDLSKLSNGVYIVKLNSGGNISMNKLIKK